MAWTLSIGAVRIVAIRALDQPLGNLMAEGHGELWLDFLVALVAQFRLRPLEQMLRRRGGVDAMAVNAAYVSFAMGRALIALVLAAMAGLTFFIHGFGFGCSRIEDRCNVAALFVRFAGAVAALAGYDVAAADSRRPAMRIVGKALCNLFVTGCAGGCIRGVDQGLLHGLKTAGIGFAWLSGHRCGAKRRDAKQQSELRCQAESLPHGRSLELPQYRPAAFDQFPPPVLQNRWTVLLKIIVTRISFSVAFEMTLRLQRNPYGTIQCAGGFSSPPGGSCVAGGLSDGSNVNGSGLTWPR